MKGIVEVGVIGTGRIAQLAHLRVLPTLPNARLVALADVEANQLQQARKRVPEAAAFERYQDLLAKPEVDAVVICLPPALHAECAIAAFRAGKHVYLEKPLATDLDEGQAVLRAWRQSGKVGAIGYNFRFHPLYRNARQHILSGSLGELVGARSVFCSASRPLPAWKTARSTGGGVLLDLASHHIDMARFLFGQEVKSITASVGSQRCECDSATLTLHLFSGLPVQSFFSMSAVDEHRFEVYGQAGKLALNRLSPDIEITQPGLRNYRLTQFLRGLRTLQPANLLRSPGQEPSFGLSLAAFVDAAASHTQIQPDLLDGFRSLEVIAAAEQSLALRQTVDLASAGQTQPAGNGA